MWLECIDVVSGCCCKEVYAFPHNNTYRYLFHLFLLFFVQSKYDDETKFLKQL